MLSRRTLLRTTVSAAALPALHGLAQLAERPPNILFILSDDHRADTIRALGNDQIHTPNLDALVRRGFAFERACVMGSMSGAVCIPSRSMILTGRSLFRSPEQPPADVPLWPQVLRGRGYDTIGIGKWHNGPASYARCFSAGGPVFFGGMTDQTRASLADFDPAGKYPASARRVAAGHATELFADAAVKFLDQRKSDKPFAMWVAFTVPHDPRMPPPKYAAMYDPASVKLPGNFMPKHPFDNGEMEVRDEKLLPRPRNEAAVRKEIAQYYAAITHMDAQIGRIFEALVRSGQAENTIVVFAGDNGLALGSHGLLGKQNLYEHSVRVPMIIAGPGIKQGRSRALCYLYDLLPTLFELSGQTVPDGVEGHSLAPVIRGEKPAVRDSAFFAYKQVQRAVTDGRFKLIHYTVRNTRTTQLFDLEHDPLEMNDLAADLSHAGHRGRLEALLADWRERAGDDGKAAVR